MKDLIYKIFEWFLKSNRWKHLIFGILIGLGADDLYCAAYCGFGVASALELKDKLWGGKWDWIDFSLTVIGVLIGYAIRVLIISLFI